MSKEPSFEEHMATKGRWLPMICEPQLGKDPKTDTPSYSSVITRTAYRGDAAIDRYAVESELWRLAKRRNS